MKARKSGNAKGHATGMAGEFFVMERLFRLGHEPALTLGQAKSIDIIVKTKGGKLQTVSVKSVRGGGKWPLGRVDGTQELIYVFLLYRSFEDVRTDPEVFVMPAAVVQKCCRRWLKGDALCYSSPRRYVPKELESYRNAWQHIG